MTTLYFTGTRNSLYIAKRIGGKLLSIPQLIKTTIYDIKEDVVEIVYPCYDSNVPGLVADYLGKANIQREYTFAGMTYTDDDFS